MKASVKSVVIKAAVVFLVIVALLTYFSGTIDSYLLPHVTVTTAGETTLKYPLRTESVLEKPADGGAPRLRFQCDRALGAFLQPGAAIAVKVSVTAGENELAFRDGTASVVESRETETGLACVAALDQVELQRGEAMPGEGSTVVINTEYETARYKHVVMKSAIQDNSYLYLVARGDDGRHYVTKAALTVIAESDFYAAVEMSAEALPVVLTATKEIHEGQRVIVDG